VDLKDSTKRPQGRVKVYLDGKNVFDDHNLVVDGYDDMTSLYLAKDFSDPIRSIAVGTGGHVLGDITTPISPVPSDSALETELFRKDIGTFANPTTNSTKYTVTFSTFEANGEITEAGIFTDSGLMIARVTFSNVTKTGAQSMLIEWTLTF
jgi:hypothetical protein